MEKEKLKGKQDCFKILSLCFFAGEIMTENLYGPQVSGDDEFKAKARLHQSKFRAEFLKRGYRKQGNWLTGADAKQGKNFYTEFDGLFEEVKKRYPYKYSQLYFNMLRSEHVPYNLFIPLKLAPGKTLAINIFNEYLKNSIKEIVDIKIEYAPEPAAKYLNDKTSFDVFIGYIDFDNSRGIIGIEVKYTEQNYSYGEKELKEMLNPNSIYYQLTKKSGIYKPECITKLKDPMFKQMWRNQLLGESMLLHLKPEFKYFSSIIIYPKGNSYIDNSSKLYKSFLKEELQEIRFLWITYENFFEIMEKYIRDSKYKDWLTYLKKRYIF